nr:His/Gly/Thr/Pro-type tRNA ligase C-terminal domain-containing protein [Alphaproteobacteria bacterium]
GDRPIAMVPLGEVAERLALKICYDLRRSGFVVDMAFRGNLSRRLKRANKLNARAALILGENEIAKKIITLRNLDDGRQVDVALDDLTAHLKKYGL